MDRRTSGPMTFWMFWEGGQILGRKKKKKFRPFFPKFEVPYHGDGPASGPMTFWRSQEGGQILGKVKQNWFLTIFFQL